MKTPLLFCLIVLAHTAFSKQTTPEYNRINYTLNLSDTVQSIIRIQLDYNPLNPDSSTFQLPTNWGDRYQLSLFKLDNQAGKGYQTYHYNSDSTEITFIHPGQTHLTIYYQINGKIADSIGNNDEIHHPQLNSHYFSAFSISILMAVKDVAHPLSRVHFDFKLPGGWKQKLYSTFGEKTQFNSPLLPNSECQNLSFHAGDYRHYTVKTKTNQHLTMVIRGTWNFDETLLLQEVSGILDQQRRFWNDYSTRNFFIVMTPVLAPDEQSMGYSGTGLYNSFSIYAFNNAATTPQNLRYLFHHELMHHWIGYQIQNATDEELSYWFSEGFTDYFARMNMLDCGMLNEKQYYEVLDSVMQQHYGKDGNSLPNDSIRAHFWDDRFIGKLPYNRGSLFALYLDNRIQQKTNGKESLKTVMQQMLADLKVKHTVSQRPFNNNWLIQTVKEKSGIDITPLIEKYILEGEPIPIEQFNEVLARKLEMRPVRVFDMGFETEKSADKKKTLVTEIKPNSGASESNLQVGDQIIGYDLYRDPNRKGRVIVSRAGEELSIDFYPYKTVTIPQFKMD